MPSYCHQKGDHGDIVCGDGLCLFHGRCGHGHHRTIQTYPLTTNRRAIGFASWGSNSLSVLFRSEICCKTYLESLPTACPSPVSLLLKKNICHSGNALNFMLLYYSNCFKLKINIAESFNSFYGLEKTGQQGRKYNPEYGSSRKADFFLCTLFMFLSMHLITEISTV